MPQPTNLNEYYTSQGTSLPSISERQNIASQAGIQGYTGSAAQNQTLLNYLQSTGGKTSSQTGISNAIPNVIPAGVAMGNVKPIDLPNKPVSTAPSTATTNANSYISSLTGVKGIDTANKAIYDVMSSTLSNPELAAKLSKANELKTKADLYNEQYRKKAEEARINPMLGAETLNSRLGALERERAFTAGTLAIEAAAANQDYTSLKSLLNDQMQIELEPLKFNRDFASDMYKRTQDQAFQRQMKAEDRAYQSALEDKKMLNDYKMQALKDGKISVSDIGKIKSFDDFTKLTGVTKNDVIQTEQAKDKIKKIDGLIDGKGISSAVGATWFGRDPLQRFLGINAGKRTTAVAETESLLSNLTLENLINAKARGATFGALSEGEMKILESSANIINQTKIVKDGKVIGYAIPEKAYNDAMKEIKKYAIMDYERRTGTKYSSPDDEAIRSSVSSSIKTAVSMQYPASQIVSYMLTKPEFSDKVQTALNAGYTPEEIVANFQ